MRKQTKAVEYLSFATMRLADISYLAGYVDGFMEDCVDKTMSRSTCQEQVVDKAKAATDEYEKILDKINKQIEEKIR